MAPRLKLYQLHTQPLKMLPIQRSHSHSMNLRSRGDQRIAKRRRMSLADCFDDEAAAKISDNGIHR